MSISEDGLNKNQANFSALNSNLYPSFLTNDLSYLFDFANPSGTLSWITLIIDSCKALANKTSFSFNSISFDEYL